MPTVLVDDALATRLRELQEADGDLEALVAEALAEKVRRLEREAQGQAEMQAMLDGPRHSVEESHARVRQKFGFSDLSHLTHEELAEQAEAAIATMNPEVRAEMEREGWL